MPEAGRGDRDGEVRRRPADEGTLSPACDEVVQHISPRDRGSPGHAGRDKAAGGAGAGGCGVSGMRADPGPVPARAFRARARWLPGVLAGAWVLVCIAGMGILWRYKETPGPATHVPR